MDLVRRFVFCLFGLVALSLPLLPSTGRAADEEAETEAPAAPNPLEKFKLQIGDEAPVPFDPIKPEDSEHVHRRKAITWQLAGQLHLSNAETDKAEIKVAENCFRQAVAADPSFMRSYQMLVSLLISGPASDEKIQEAKQVAFQAAENSSEGFTLVRQLAGLLARTQVDRGISVLNEALTIKRLEQKSVTYYQIQRDLGLFYRLAGNNPKAAECYQLVFDAVTKNDPALFSAQQIQEIVVDPVALYEEMGEVFLSIKKPNEALAAFNKASEARGSQSAAHAYNLAQIFRETGKSAESLAELQKYLDAQLQTKGRNAYQLLKDLLTDLKQESELVDRLEKLRAKDPQNSQLRYFLAEQYVEQSRFQEAEQAILNGQAEPKDTYSLVGLIPVYRGQKKYELLLNMFVLYNINQLPDPDQNDQLGKLDTELQTLLRRYARERDLTVQDADTMNAFVKLGKEWMQGDEAKIQFSQAHVLGELCGAADRIDDAKVFYRQAIDMQNEPPLKLFLELGQLLQGADRYDEAIEILRECANHPSQALQDSRWRTLYMLSYALEFAGKTDEAIAAATESKALGEKSGLGDFVSILHAQIGWVNYHAQRLDEAIRIYEEVLTRYPKTELTAQTLENCRFSLSAVYVLKGDMVKGESILEQILAENPENPQANNDLGYLWADQGKNLEKALVMITKALTAEPENAAYIDSMGWVLFKLGRVDEAAKKLEQAVAMKRGDDPTLHEHLGDCYAKLGRTDDARKIWTKAMELMDKKKSKDEKLKKSLRERLGLPAE
jgi:tetratricopeptide (TPR) repeat protein